MYGDLDWRLNASLGFVSISWAELFYVTSYVLQSIWSSRRRSTWPWEHVNERFCGGDSLREALYQCRRRWPITIVTVRNFRRCRRVFKHVWKYFSLANFCPQTKIDILFYDKRTSFVARHCRSIIGQLLSVNCHIADFWGIVRPSLGRPPAASLIFATLTYAQTVWSKATNFGVW